jgi:hypothetical protein
MKNSQRPLFLLHQTLQLPLCIGAGRVLLALCHSSRRLTLSMGILGLCGCSAMEIHLMKLQTNSYCDDVASRDSLELGGECCNQGQTIHATFFSSRRSRSVNLCGLPLTVDRGSCSRAEIWLTDLLERWHPMTVPCWKSLSSSVRTLYCHACLWRLHGCVLNFILLSATDVAEIVIVSFEVITHLKGCPHTLYVDNVPTFTRPPSQKRWGC